MATREMNGGAQSRSNDSLHGSWVEVYSNGEDIEVVSGQQTPLGGSCASTPDTSAAIRAMLREAAGRFEGSPHVLRGLHLPRSPMLEPVTDDSELASQIDDSDDDHRGLMRSLSALMGAVGDLETPSPCFSVASKSTHDDAGIGFGAIHFGVEQARCYQCRWERRAALADITSGNITPLSSTGVPGIDLTSYVVGAGLKGAFRDARGASPFQEAGCNVRHGVFLCRRHLVDADILWDWSYPIDSPVSTSTPPEKREIRVGRRRYRRGKLKNMYHGDILTRRTRLRRVGFPLALVLPAFILSQLLSIALGVCIGRRIACPAAPTPAAATRIYCY
eukprot:Opistho-1_new@8577